MFIVKYACGEGMLQACAASFTEQHVLDAILNYNGGTQDEKHAELLAEYQVFVGRAGRYSTKATAHEATVRVKVAAIIKKMPAHEQGIPFHVPSVHRTGTGGPCTIDLRSSACTGGERRAALAVGAALPAGFRPPDDLPHFLARHGATAPHRTPGVARRPSPRRLLTYGNFHGHFHCSGIIGNYHALSVVTGESGGHSWGPPGL